MRPVLLTLAALALLGLLGAVAVSGLGLYNVSAKVGHLPGVSWVLHKTYRNAVRLRAPPSDTVPDTIGDPDLIALGARHYEMACAFCHAAPGKSQSATATAMLPRPPHITDAVADWETPHLFWIVREGVKMSGMPHWPADGRDDEVWSVVAYLDVVRRGMPVPVAEEHTGSTASYCAGCHGENGRSTNRFVPRLDILSHEYIQASMAAYRSGARQSGIMAQAATYVDETNLDSLNDWPAKGETDLTAEMSARGTPTDSDALARKGNREVPACTACHGPDATEVSPLMPALAGQTRAYLETQLRLWREGARGGTDRANLMAKAAARLDDAEIRILADWYAGLNP